MGTLKILGSGDKLTLNGFLRQNYPRHHFTAVGIENRASTLIVDPDTHRHYRKDCHTIDCFGPKGGVVRINIDYAKTRGSYRVH